MPLRTKELARHLILAAAHSRGLVICSFDMRRRQSHRLSSVAEGDNTVPVGSVASLMFLGALRQCGNIEPLREASVVAERFSIASQDLIRF